MRIKMLTHVYPDNGAFKRIVAVEGKTYDAFYDGDGYAVAKVNGTLIRLLRNEYEVLSHD